MDPETRQLSGRRIVVTRSEADNRVLAVELVALGAEVIEVPLVEVLPPEDGGQALAEAVARMADYDWVTLTSANGVDALRAALGANAWPNSVTVVPVGPITEAAARAAGMSVHPPPEVATAKDLVAGFDDRPNGSPSAAPRVLAPLAELAGDTLVDGLTAKGYNVDRVTAYRTAAPRTEASLTAAVVDAVVFFSPSVVDRFIDRFGDRFGADATAALSAGRVDRLTFPPAICIGPSTAERAAERGFANVVIAEPHTAVGITDAIGRLFAA